MTTSIEPSPADTGIRIIPPLVMLGALVASFLLDWMWPSRVGLPDAVRWIIGVPLLVAPFLIFPSVFAAFRRVGAQYDVRQVPQGLVTGGAFRFSRNPGYVLMVGFTAGIGLVANNPWTFLMMVPAIAIVHVGVILREEQVLENQFGEVYLNYKRRVRRWI